MSTKNVQFAVSTHIATVLAYHPGQEVTTATLAASVRAEPTFVRRSVARLAKAGLIVTTRGKHGACTLARAPEEITLLDLYRASEAPPNSSNHTYSDQPSCPVSPYLKPSMQAVLDDAQAAYEARLAQRTLAEVVDAVRRAGTGPSGAMPPVAPA
jgi:Rrf2 family protein